MHILGIRAQLRHNKKMRELSKVGDAKNNKNTGSASLTKAVF